MPEMDGQAWKRPQRAEIYLLPDRLVGIAWRTFHASSEIPDRRNAVTRKQQRTQPRYVEPAVRRSLHSSVIKIETVDVDVSAHEKAAKRAEAARKRLRTLPRKVRGDYPTEIIDNAAGRCQGTLADSPKRANRDTAYKNGAKSAILRNSGADATSHGRLAAPAPRAPVSPVERRCPPSPPKPRSPTGNC